MENVINGNLRILIGQELGEIYLIIQKFINNSWQHIPNNKYRGNYFVDKKIRELLTGSIHSIRRNPKSDMVKFRIDKTAHVYISDYSIIKDYPELKLLVQVLTRKIVLQKVSEKMVIVKNIPQQAIDNRIINFLLASTISLGLVSQISHNIENKNEIDTIKNDIINPTSDIIPTSESFDINGLNEIINNHYKSETLSDLKSKEIATHKINDNYSLEEYNQKTMEQTPMIEKYANMYYMNTNDVLDFYNSNQRVIITSDNPEKSFLMIVKDEFYSDNSIDKNPIVSDMNREEKEQCIIDIAKNIYKIEDENTLAIMLSIHRLETGNGESRRCVEDNNLGGLRNGSFLEFKTFEIGAEAFVRNTLKLINETYSLSDYDYNISFEKNMQKIYCEGESDWGEQIEDIKYTILSNGDLDNYLENLNEEQQKVYSKSTNMN